MNNRKWLSEARGQKTQQEVAKLAGIGRAFYTQIENGSRNPSVPVAQRISKALKIDWTIFFEDKCSERPQFTGSGRKEAI